MYKAINVLKQLFPQQFHDRIFLVGGSVRDHLLGRKNKDFDLAASLSSREFMLLGFCQVTGKSSVPIWFRHDSFVGSIEVIQLEDNASLGEDLLRRDFSINAMAISLSGELFDPLGGQQDIQSGTLRTCSESSFFNDPLRIFRAFRFETDGWLMSNETQIQISGFGWNKAFHGIPVERFSREMIKALSANSPEVFFKNMLKFKVGTEYLPELFLMPDIPAGPLQYHPEGDLFTHSIQVLQATSKHTSDPLVRFCAFFHDIGKLATDPALYPKHHGHDQAGFKLAPSFCDRLRLPAQYRTALTWVSRLHTTLNLWDQLRDSTKLRMAEQALKAGISVILPVVSNADKFGAFNDEEWENTLRIAGMTIKELGIESDQLTSVKESKRKDYILQKQIELLNKLK